MNPAMKNRITKKQANLVLVFQIRQRNQMISVKGLGGP